MSRHQAPRGRFWHTIRHNKTARLPTRFIVVDTETRATNPSGLAQEHHLWFGVAHYFDLPNNPKKIAHRATITFYSPHEFWDWVEEHTSPRSRTILTAHNLQFDFMILDSIIELSKRGWDVEFPITAGARFISTARKQDRTLLLLDSMNFAPVSLRELGDSLGIYKFEMPSMPEIDAAWIVYCERDVEIVEMFWVNLLQFLRENDYGSFGQTVAALAFKIFRHAFLKHKIVIHPQSKTCAFERSALKGGRNECYRIGKLPDQDYYLLDVNSLYPSVMALGNFPTCLRFHYKATKVKKLSSWSRRYFVVARVGIETDEPAYPVTRNGKLIFPIGRFETTLCGAELDHALKFDRVKYCAEVAVYDREPIFKDFATTLYHKRLEYKNADNAAFALMTKLIMNSLYGKFGQKAHVREELPDRHHVRFGFERMYSKKLHSQVNVTYWNGKGIQEYEQGETFDSFPAISAAVTSYGRQALWEYMNIAGLDHTFYVDTDSLLVDRVGLERLRAYIDRDKLGALKIEKTTRDVVLRGKKDYKLGEIEKVKGISRTATRIDFRIYDVLHFSTLLESVRSGKTSGVTVTSQRKVMDRRYDAGVVLGDGTVSPIALTTF